MATQADDIADVVIAVQRDLGRMKWTSIAIDLQEHVALPRLMQKKKVGFQGSRGIQFNVTHRTSGTARNVGLYQNDDVDVVDVATTGNLPWRHTTVNYGYDRRELAMVTGPHEVVDLIKMRRNASMEDLSVLMEQNFWTKPTDSTDTVKPFGVPYWIVKNASTGFNGGNPSGFTAGAAGISSTTYPNWSNWTAQYTDISKADLITKWREASVKTHFKPPVPHPDYNVGDNYGYFTTYDVVAGLESILEAQNDNLGKDIASMDGQVMFRRVPVTYVPYLEENDSQKPVYGINWGVFRPVFLRGEYLKESPPIRNGNSHFLHEVHVDLSYNFECRDRRRNFVLATA